MAPIGFLVYVKDKCIVIDNIDLDMYFSKDLYSDVISKAKEQHVSLPRFIGFEFHAPFKDTQRVSLVCDSDWAKMVEHWVGTPSTYIPLYIVELQEPNILQTMTEAIEGTAQTYYEVEEWADNLLVTPTECIRTPISEGRTSNRTKLVVRRNSSKIFEVQPQPSFIDPESIHILTQSSLTVSKRPPSPSHNPPHCTPQSTFTSHLYPTWTDPNNNHKEEGENDKGHKKRKMSKRKSVGDGGIQQFEITQLSAKLLAKELKGLEAYDIPTLSQPYIPPLDVFFEELVEQNPCGETVSGEEKGYSEDDDEESDYEDGEKESGSSEDVSLDEESHSEDEFEVEANTADVMRLGHVEDDGEKDSKSIVNKMAKVYRTGKLWVRGRDGKIELKVGDIFSCKEDFLRIMKDYCIEKGIFLKKIKNDKKKYTHICKNEKCRFRIHVSALIDGHSWMIKSFTDGHVCAVKEHHKRAGASWVASHMLEEFRSNREMNAVTVQKRVLSKFNTHIPNYTCWRALKLMRNMVEGRHEDGYKHLPQYMEVFKDRNPDSKCFIRWEEIGPGRNPIFRRCQICIGSAITTFKQHCKPLIGIDACHLKGPYQGILLTAMALDGNNGQFPLAYGVADCEDEFEWCFFLNGLADALGCLGDSSPYTIISDRHLAIIKGLHTVLPKASRRICVLHFYKNFASKFPGAWFHSLFYIVANTFSEYVFNRAMDKIKEENVEAYEWLEKNEAQEHWARHKFNPSLKCEDNTNNFVESFNKAIVAHRAKPVLQMLEEIRKLVGNRFEKRFGMGRSWSSIVTPYADKKLREIAIESRLCLEVAAGRGEFDVLDGTTNFTVRLRDHSCDCNRWQVSGLPCKHAARCILRINENLENYCAPWFSVKKYRALYDGIIHPIPDPCMWGESSLPNLDPPKHMKKKGRPKKHRRRDGIDDVIAKQHRRIAHGTKRCSKCKELGHNHRTCGQGRDEGGRLMKKKTMKKKVSPSA